MNTIMSSTKSEIEVLRECLPEYLMQKNLPLKKPFRCLNPLHEDKNPSMSYNAAAQNVHCFSCGVTYDIFDLVGTDYNLSGFGPKLNKTGELFGYTHYPPKKKDGGLKKAAPSTGVLTLERDQPVMDRTDELDELRKGSVQTEYLYKRGITQQSISRFGLFETEERVYFPIIERGICTGYLGRSNRDKDPRYKNSSGPIGIFGGDYITAGNTSGRLFVTEGVIDAICLEQMGYHAIALCGSQNTGKLLRMVEDNSIFCRGISFVLCGDGDDAGQGMNRKLQSGFLQLGVETELLEVRQGADVAALYLEDITGLRNSISALDDAKNKQRAEYAGTSAAAYIERFFTERENRRRSVTSTGFAMLDKSLDGGLYPGLYVLGAISSLGKTSFALQMADNIAGERDVLFISLEQSRHELVSKSLSRITSSLDTVGKGLTTRQVMSGDINIFGRRLLEDAAVVYAQTARSLFIIEGCGDLGVEYIREAVSRHVDMRGAAPLVVVDYLQILAPADSRATDKQNTDRAVVELRRLSRDFQMPVLAISSFNRENYRQKVSMESFKESGAVEYSADVLLAMQLKGAGDRDFDINAAKSKEPREVQIVVLKNRSGLPYAEVDMKYDARFNLFEE